MTIAPTQLDIRPLCPVIGAEVCGLDISQKLPGEVIDTLRAALNEHLVLFFRDQDLSPSAQADFARQFGELTPAHPVIPALESHPEVLPIDSKDDKSDFWHTDVTYLGTPPLGSLLYMVECPEVGGDTEWVNLQAAYDALSEPVRALCDRLIAYHWDPFFAEDIDKKGGFEWDGKWIKKLYPVSHPVVRTHPETGRNGLFVNSQFTVGLEGLSKLEADTILDMLYRHCMKPEFGCRFRWREGSMAFWDNRATLHYAINDYGDTRRIAHRVTLRGEPAYGPARPSEKKA